MKGFETMFRCVREPIREGLDPDQTERAHAAARDTFEKIIPQLPYIGDKKNRGTTNLIGSA